MLTSDQISFFARNGFVQVPNAIAPAACEHLVEETWRRLPQSWGREAPQTWTGEIEDSCHVADLAFRRGHMKFQKGTLPSDPHIVAAFAEGSPAETYAKSLLGEDLAPVLVRGLYSIAPTTELEPFKSPHVEAHPIQVVAVGYLADVEQGGGGLLIWPGSHKALYGAFDSKLEFSARPEYARLVKTYSGLRPIELSGRAGDVILMHHRLFHAPNLNHSPDRIRFATFCDYRRRDYRELCAQSPGEVWEDWATPLHDGRLDAPTSDFEMLAHRKSGSLAETPSNLADSSINKRDATQLARARKVGETWIVLSDSPVLAKSRKIEPTGSRIRDRAWLQVNGRPVESLSQNDIIARVDLRGGNNLIEVAGLADPLWMKIIEIASPFEDSRVVCHAGLSVDQPAAIVRLFGG